MMGPGIDDPPELPDPSTPKQPLALQLQDGRVGSFSPGSGNQKGTMYVPSPDVMCGV